VRSALECGREAAAFSSSSFVELSVNAEGKAGAAAPAIYESGSFAAALKSLCAGRSALDQTAQLSHRVENAGAKCHFHEFSRAEGPK